MVCKDRLALPEMLAGMCGSASGEPIKMGTKTCDILEIVLKDMLAEEIHRALELQG
jgi:hypothetical protein